MGIAELLAAAADAGLSVAVDGSRVVIRGPKSASGLARQLLDRKAEVLRVLGDAGTDAEQIDRDTASAIVPPSGAALFFESAKDGRPCGPGDDVRLWTWAGASRWYDAAINPPPRL